MKHSLLNMAYFPPNRVTRRANKKAGKCNRCGGEMKPGQAMQGTLVGEPDDLGGVVTVSPGGLGKLVPCMKCAECGWSVTVGESK